MAKFNGKTTIPEHLWTEPDQLIQTDTTLLGMGCVLYDIRGTECIHRVIPTFWSGQHVCVYELLAILISLKVWGERLHNKRVVLQCDNSPSVILLKAKVIQ